MATRKKAEEKAVEAESVENRAVDLPEKVTPLEPQEPVKVPSAMGATFAERKAARSKAVKSAENKSVKG